MVSYTITDREGVWRGPPTPHPEGRVSTPDKRRFHITNGLLIRCTLGTRSSSGAFYEPSIGPAFMVCGLPGTPNTQNISRLTDGDGQQTMRSSSINTPPNGTIRVVP